MLPVSTRKSLFAFKMFSLQVGVDFRILNSDNSAAAPLRCNWNAAARTQ
jgi:hypothetical protein